MLARPKFARWICIRSMLKTFGGNHMNQHVFNSLAVVQDGPNSNNSWFSTNVKAIITHNNHTTVKSSIESSTVEKQIADMINNLKEGQFKPSLDYFRRASRVLHQCKTREQLLAALPLCNIVEQSPIIHGTAAIECVRIYQKHGMYKEVLRLTDKLFANNYFLINPVLVNAIQACSSLGDVEKGFQIFDNAVARGTIPNVSTFSALLSLCGTAGDTERVKLVLAKMQTAGFEMSNITYHTLMSSYSKGGHTKEAFSVFEEMKQKEISLDEHTYSILIDAHADEGDFDRAFALMDELRSLTSLKPNLVNYNIMLKVCGKSSRLAKAFLLYEEMKDRKINPDLVTYITMMHAVYHGEMKGMDQKKVKAALGAIGLMGISFLPFIDFEEHVMTVLFTGSLVGSMGLAIYLNPDGVSRALYPNLDEPKNDSIINAIFRRLSEEDHCGRAMYLWRELNKYGVTPDLRIYDVFVRTCVRKRHPELACEAIFKYNLPLTCEGEFVLSLTSTVQLLHSLLVQGRMPLAQKLFDAAWEKSLFKSIFSENGSSYRYNLTPFSSTSSTSFAISRILESLKLCSKANAMALSSIEFTVLNGFDLLDKLDVDQPKLRTLFSMDEMIIDESNPQAYHLMVTEKVLSKYFSSK